MATSSVQKNDIPMFLAKLWNLVDDPLTNSLIHWDSTGHSFIVHDPGTFSKVLLPQYFKHRNMASFIRVLNMYGFRKVVKLDSGSLQSVKDEMEFQHPCFVRGNEQLLIHIKRKLSAAPTQVQKSLATINSIPTENQNPDPEASKILEEIQTMRAKQEAMQTQFDELKRENETVWAELQDVRSKHAHQQIVVNKLIEFFITLLHSTGNVTNTALRAAPSQLAIQNAAGTNGPLPVKRARTEKDGPSNPADYHGPIIRDVTDEWSNYAQQDPQEVDWDRLLSLDDDLSDMSAANGTNTVDPANSQGLNGIAPTMQPPYSPAMVPQSMSPVVVTPNSPAGMLPVNQQAVQNGRGTPAPYARNLDVANALAAVYGAQANNQSAESLDSGHMEQQVNRMQTSLDSIRGILQNPQFNLDFSQIFQPYPSPGSDGVTNHPQTTQATDQIMSANRRPVQLPPPNAVENTTSSSSVPGNQLVEYIPHNMQNMEDNYLLGMDEGDDFMKVFANLPNDDMIEGVTIQIPEYVQNPNDLASLTIPLPSSNSTGQMIPQSPSGSGGFGGKRKRKSTNPVKA